MANLKHYATERSQTQKTTQYMISLYKKFLDETFRETESISVVAQGWEME